ncbi:YwqJ-related putative deaminase [Streptomyces lichenis]|uniref:YwqJ-related putative deaminase n=1 Tax=Streptomyces lichenis TaxID=2306967 RepID=A0ABT0I4K9_9ACTN|nr:YwqJ-related putative deaminase [Streptomyces lichenis]MCK8676267.1 YwqJ-related putative deaminase [Streptomyces lichenis]
MSENQPVNPAEVPVFTGDLEVLDAKVKALSGTGGKIATAAGDVHTSFGGLRAFYQAPEAEQLFATTQPVKDKALAISGDMCTITGALGSYASEVRPLKQKLDDLRQAAVDFRTKIAEDDKWREDGDLVEENNDRRNEIAEVWTQFQAAERSAHAKIVALVGGKALKVNDGSNGEGMYGYDAEALKGAKSLPWGEAVEESTPWWQVWEHAYDFGKGIIVDGVWGTIKGLGTLVGFQGWDAAGQAWKGLGQLATGLAITATPLAAVYWTADDKDLPAWLRDSRTAMKETGKALVAWDQWGSNPARAAGAVTFNVLTTVFTGGAGGAAAGAGKAGAVAKAISFAGKAGRAIDPATYLFKGAGMGFTKIGDAMSGIRAMGNIDIPAIPEGTVILPEGSLALPDGTIRLPDGAELPPGGIEIPADAVRLPEGAAVPPGAVDLGDGVVKLPEDTPVPAGATPLEEGTVALPKDTPAIPQDSLPLQQVDEASDARYFDREGNLLDGHGKVVSSSKDAPTDVVDRATLDGTPDAPTSGADNPRVDTPQKVPALAGAAVHTGDNAPIHLGGDLDTNLGDVGRVGDDLPGHVGDDLPARLGDDAPGRGPGGHAPGGLGNHGPGGLGDHLPGGRAGDHLPSGHAGDHLPGGSAGDHLPSNSLDHTPPGGHGDGPGTGGNGHEAPGGHGDGPGTGGNGHEAPGGHGDGPGTGGHGDGPGTGAVDEGAAGADDAGRAGDEGNPVGHAGDGTDVDPDNVPPHERDTREAGGSVVDDAARRAADPITIGDQPLPPAGPGEKVLGVLEESRVRRDKNNLISLVDGRPVEHWLKDLAFQRATLYREAKELGTFPRKQTGACIGPVMDLRTGMVVEGINGKATNIIPEGRVHPTVAARQAELHPQPAPDHPLGHAEVKAVNELLWERRKRGLPDDESALSELRASIEFPYMNHRKTDLPGRPAPFCANCHHMLDGVDSAHGRFTGNPASDENWIPE